jgi:hypothetical protein
MYSPKSYTFARMDIKGKVVQVFDKVTGTSKTGNTWSKQEFLLEYGNQQYPKKFIFHLWGEKIDQFALKEGEEVQLSVDLESREFNGRWYTDVRAWNVQKSGASGQSNAGQSSSAVDNPAEVSSMLLDSDFSSDNANNTNDLPF